MAGGAPGRNHDDTIGSGAPAYARVPAGPGSVGVQAEPVGVACFLDGQFVGYTVPAFVAERQASPQAGPSVTRARRQGLPGEDRSANEPAPSLPRLPDDRLPDDLDFYLKDHDYQRRKVEMMCISFFLLVGRRGLYPPGFAFLG